MHVGIWVEVNNVRVYSRKLLFLKNFVLWMNRFGFFATIAVRRQRCSIMLWLKSA